MTRTTTALIETGRVLAPLLIIAVAVVMFMELGQRPAPAKQERGDTAPLVETEPVRVFEGAFIIHADGVALPARRMTLSAEVDGRIISRSEQALGGRALQLGTPLFEIDPTDHELRVRQLKTQLKQANEEIASVDVECASLASLIEIAQETWTVQRRALARAEKLASADATTDGQVDQAQTSELSSRNSLQLLRNQLAEAEQRKRTQLAASDLVAVQLEEANTNLERTKVTAPIVGTVVTLHVEANDFVRRGDPLIEISDSSHIEIRCSLLVEQIYWVWLAAGRLTGSQSPDASPAFLPPPDNKAVPSVPPLAELEIPKLPVRVLYDFGGGPVAWQGVLSRYEGSGLDQQTRTVPCRILIDNPTQPIPVGDVAEFDLSRTPPRLFTGMFVDIELPIDPPIELLQVPIAALRAGGQVWIVREGTLRIELVDVARMENEFVLIRRPESLREGDRVVVSPLAAAMDGMRVRELHSTDSALEAQP